MSYTDIFGSQTVPPSDYSLATYTLTAATTQVYWATAVPDDAPYLAKITRVSASTPSAIQLQSAQAQSVGFDFIIENNGAQTITVLDAQGTTLFAVTAGQLVYFYLVSNATDAGVWGTTVYGAGVTSAQAVTLAGNGLGVDSNKLYVKADSEILTSSRAVTTLDLAKVLVAETGSLVLTLPALAGLIDGFFFYFKNSSEASATLQPSGLDTIDGNVSKVFYPNEAGIVIAVASGWYTIGYGKDVEFVFSEFIVNAAAANPTLTTSDVSGRMIRITGTAASNKTITLPPVPGIYFVTTDGGLGSYLAIFTTGTGTTVNLPANQSTVLYCDGTNIRIAVSTSVQSTLALVDGAAAAPSLNWSISPTTGFYRSGTDVIGFSAAGVGVGTLSSAGWSGPAAINAGTITGITDLAVADGGTGASDAPAARTNLGAAASATNFTAGLGLTGGGTLASDRDFALGTPSTLSISSINEATVDSHTHAVTFPVTSVAGKTGAVTLAKADVGLSNVADVDTTNASNISSGTLANARTTGTSANTASTLVLRGASGEISTGNISCTGTVTATVNLTLSSDARLKNSVVSLSPSLSLGKVLNLRPVSYKLNGYDKQRIGLIAQEAAYIVPEVVHANDEGGYLSIEYQNLVALLISAIQEQQQQIDQLKSRL